MAIARSNSATLLVGPTTTGKTSLIATFADWVWRKHKKVTLYYLCDGGGYGSQLEALIDRGIVWVWKMRTRGEAFETCARATKGYWPAEIINTNTGESTRGCKLLPPTTTSFKLYCPCGNLVTTSPIKGPLTRKTLCTNQSCKKLVDITTPGSKVEESTFRTPGMESVGAVAYDGLSSMQEWIMGSMSDMTAQGQLKGEGSNLGGVIISGEEKIGGNNRSHYGFAQSRGERWILETTAIPGLVAPPIWTALEEKSTDKETKIVEYGPKLAGSAKTSIAPQWVGNCLGTQVYQDPKRRNIWRLNLTEYRDPVDNIPHLCKNRAMPGMLPDYLEDTYDEDGGIERFSNFNLGTFFDLLDAARDQAIKSAEDRYSDAPGLPTGKIGEGTPEVAVEPVKPATTNNTPTQTAPTKAPVVSAKRRPRVGARAVPKPATARSN